jgi:hypothetical protein
MRCCAVLQVDIQVFGCICIHHALYHHTAIFTGVRTSGLNVVKVLSGT